MLDEMKVIQPVKPCDINTEAYPLGVNLNWRWLWKRT